MKGWEYRGFSHPRLQNHLKHEKRALLPTRTHTHTNTQSVDFCLQLHGAQLLLRLFFLFWKKQSVSGNDVQHNTRYSRKEMQKGMNAEQGGKKKVHGGEKKALQHHIKYPQLSSWIIDGWAAVVYWAACTEKHPGILAGMSKHLPSQRCKLEPFTFFFFFFLPLIAMMQRGPPTHQHGFKQFLVTLCRYITQLIRTHTTLHTHWPKCREATSTNLKLFNLTFWRIFPIQMQRISVKRLHQGGGGRRSSLKIASIVEEALRSVLLFFLKRVCPL